MPRPFRPLLLLVGTFALFVAVSHAQQPGTLTADAVRSQIERALADAPRNYERLLSPQQAGVRVLGVEVRSTSQTSETLAIDLSQRALTYEPSGNIEPLLDRIIQATAASVGAMPVVEYRFTIDGLPVEQFLPRAAAPISPRAPGTLGGRRSLAEGGTVLVSPGHGWYWDEVLRTWHLQRPRINGIVEDNVNWDIAKYLRDELLAANINTQLARYQERDEAVGPSGRPRWEEAARYFIQAAGTPAEIWNLGVDDYARDINARPLYANWIDASLVIAIHNNGGEETGTETWFDGTNGQQDESLRLAGIVNRHVVSAIRARYNANWVDRGLRTCNGCKGENRLVSRPAIIVEIAYMDTASPDNDALHDDAFKRIVAQAIREAVEEWAQR